MLAAAGLHTCSYAVTQQSPWSLSSRPNLLIPRRTRPPGGAGLVRTYVRTWQNERTSAVKTRSVHSTGNALNQRACGTSNVPRDFKHTNRVAGRLAVGPSVGPVARKHDRLLAPAIIACDHHSGSADSEAVLPDRWWLAFASPARPPDIQKTTS